MPIYEYICEDCNVIFSFMSKVISPESAPKCPRCSSRSMKKQLSTFSSSSEKADLGTDFDEKRVEHAFDRLLEGAEKLTAENAGEVTSLMESFVKKSGYDYSGKLKEAIKENIDLEPASVNDTLSSDQYLVSRSGGADSKQALVRKSLPPEIDPSIFSM